jgi:hypothetical protein
LSSKSKCLLAVYPTSINQNKKYSGANPIKLLSHTTFRKKAASNPLSEFYLGT